MRLKRRRVTVRVTELDNPKNITEYVFLNLNNTSALSRARQFKNTIKSFWGDDLKVELIGKYS